MSNHQKFTAFYDPPLQHCNTIKDSPLHRCNGA